MPEPQDDWFITQGCFWMMISALVVITVSYSSQKFTELHDSNGDEMGHANPWTLVLSDPISYEV